MKVDMHILDELMGDISSDIDLIHKVAFYHPETIYIPLINSDYQFVIALMKRLADRDGVEYAGPQVPDYVYNPLDFEDLKMRDDDDQGISVLNYLLIASISERASGENYHVECEKIGKKTEEICRKAQSIQAFNISGRNFGDFYNIPATSSHS